jgi:hypothetical protein
MRSVRYVNGGSVPKSISKGRVLCHNHIQHGPNTPCGVNGFRAWTDTKPPQGFAKCPCGYAGLPHYARRDHVAGIRKGQPQIDPSGSAEEQMPEWS